MTEPRIFAADTKVPVDKTKIEISNLLRDWGCLSMTWGEHMDPPAGILEFTWKNEGAIYRIRFTVVIPTKNQKGQTYNAIGMAQSARTSYRLLLLKLKADLNAVVAGLAKAEEILMPWMVDLNGKTIAEVLIPQLREQFKALPPGPKT